VHGEGGFTSRARSVEGFGMRWGTSIKERGVDGGSVGEKGSPASAKRGWPCRVRKNKGKRVDLRKKREVTVAGFLGHEEKTKNSWRGHSGWQEDLGRKEPST